MLNPHLRKKNPSFTIRNLITLFTCISVMAYFHWQIQSANLNTSHTNMIVKSMLKNQTYWINKLQYVELEKGLNAKQYFTSKQNQNTQINEKSQTNQESNKAYAQNKLSQSQCLVKIYLDVLNNQQVLQQTTKAEQSKQANKVIKDSSQEVQYFSNQLKQLNFNSLLNFPLSDSHDLQNIKSCSDLITIMNYLNPTKMDFIYTNFVQQKYHYLNQKSENTKSHPKNKQSNTKFCILVNQMNTSLTSLRANLNSLTQQTYEDYKLVILDNGSGDGSYQISKIIIQDFKQKQILPFNNQHKQHQKRFKQKIQAKYRVIKQQKRLNEWELFLKHSQQCSQSEYIIFVDGRDQLVSRHVLSILDNQIKEFNKKNGKKPLFITSSLLNRNHLSRSYPISSIQDLSQYPKLPSYTFKVLKQDLYHQTRNQITYSTKQYNTTYQVDLKITKILSQNSLNLKSFLQINEMLYVYDNSISGDSTRRQYFLKGLVKQYEKIQKAQRTSQIKK